MPRVSIVLINLNGYADTVDCIESLTRINYPNYEIIVVDNGSSDGSGDRISERYPGLPQLKSLRNLGFSGGCNLGIRDALSREADYVLLLNNDTVVAPDFLSRLVTVAERDPRIGIVGPKIFYRGEPQKIWFAGGQLRRVDGAIHHLGLNKTDASGEFSIERETDFITGCALLAKSSLFERVGMLDENLFAYFEDIDLCARAARCGYRHMFVPSSHIWHKVSSTWGQKSPLTLYMATRNQLRWVATYSRYPFKPFALTITLSKKVARMVVETFRSPSGGKAVARGILHFIRGIYGPPQELLIRPISAK